ncbi:MAG: sugar transferase [Muribaculaceae bacterium]|nr:sugar transferase [Muribaculaceae bacterium]
MLKKHAERRVAVMLDIMSKVGYRGKRFFDIVGASAMLVISTVIILPVAIAIKLTSAGPVIFRQKRVGLDGHIFTCYKLRTMYLNDRSDIDITYPGDPRITPLGKILRRFSIDEIPQLFNVISGDMSLIGPRPHMLTQDRLFEDTLPSYAERRQVRPGITGLAQVTGFRGPTGEPWQKEGRLARDLEYIKKMSPAGDIQILFKTIWVVLTTKG